MTHTIKIYEDYIEPILKGDKNFEVRENDRGYQKGDLLKFEPEAFGDLADDIAAKTYEITYVHSGLGLEKGYVVFGIKEVQDANPD